MLGVTAGHCTNNFHHAPSFVITDLQDDGHSCCSCSHAQPALTCFSCWIEIAIMEAGHCYLPLLAKLSATSTRTWWQQECATFMQPPLLASYSLRCWQWQVAGQWSRMPPRRSLLETSTGPRDQVPAGPLYLVGR